MLYNPNNYTFLMDAATPVNAVLYDQNEWYKNDLDRLNDQYSKLLNEAVELCAFDDLTPLSKLRVLRNFIFEYVVEFVEATDGDSTEKDQLFTFEWKIFDDLLRNVEVDLNQLVHELRLGSVESIYKPSRYSTLIKENELITSIKLKENTWNFTDSENDLIRNSLAFYATFSRILRRHSPVDDSFDFILKAAYYVCTKGKHNFDVMRLIADELNINNISVAMPYQILIHKAEEIHRQMELTCKKVVH